MASIVTARIGLELAIEALGTFKIADFLGNGAFGEVFRAINKETGAPVAVKLLPLAEFEDEQSKSALINEIKAAASITHPNIVQVLHVDEGKNTELGAEQNRQRTNQAQLYKTAWEELLAILDTVVNEFNAESDTPIEISNPLDSISQTVYKLPHGRPVACTVFPPIEKSISVRGGKIVGGGWIGVEGGRSANLVLLRNPSDLYGHWTLCEVSINALVDA